MKLIDQRFIRHCTKMDVKIVDSCTSAFDEIGNHEAIVALRQTAGVGCGENTFFSPNGGIYLVMRATGMHINPHTLTPAVGLAVHDTILSVLGIHTKVKWVNDLMYEGKKVVGILVKSPRKAEYLIGVGVNYSTNPKEFEKAKLGDIATSLEAPQNRASMFVLGLLNSIRHATLAEFDNIKYNNLCLTVGKNVEFVHNATKVHGYAESVAPDGSLIVRIGNATVAVDAGEVSIIRNIDEEYENFNQFQTL
ncbi:MAG: biotin--[acetyl-CoA-carboxylase] ligase [Clostridiales bacterium]|nr:biotin--[acetyl-CoA-carboxylase] ligase [Clostridiales bacterium]